MFEGIFYEEKNIIKLPIMCPFFTTLFVTSKFLDEHFHFHTKKIETKIPTTTRDSNTVKASLCPIPKGKIHTSYGFSLSSQFSSLLLGFLPNKLGVLQETKV
jgi:hypothetical protein